MISSATPRELNILTYTKTSLNLKRKQTARQTHEWTLFKKLEAK